MVETHWDIEASQFLHAFLFQNPVYEKACWSQVCARSSVLVYQMGMITRSGDVNGSLLDDCLWIGINKVPEVIACSAMEPTLEIFRCFLLCRLVGLGS